MEDRERTEEQIARDAAAWLLDDLGTLVVVEWVPDDRVLREGQRMMRLRDPEVWEDFERWCKAAQVSVPGPDWEAGA